MRMNTFFLLLNLALVIFLASASALFAALPSGNSALQFTSTQLASRTTPISTVIDNLTMQCWVKWDGGSVGTIFYNGNGSFTGYGIIVQPGTNNLGLLCGGVTVTYSSTPLVLNTWQHLALVRNAGAWSLYVNGIATTLASVSVPSAPAPAPTLSDVLRFSGVIDEVSFWSAPITPANILAYKDQPISAGHPNFASLVAYYPLNEGTGQVAGSGSAGLDLQLGSTAGVDADDPTWITSTAPLVPTLGEWGMIILGAVLLYAGYRYISRRRTAAIA